MIAVLVVDDEALVRDGLRAILDGEPELTVVGEAADGARAVALAAELSPDVVLMDVRMPVLDGVEACRRICGQPDPPRVLMLTTFDHDDYLVRAMRAGASGFLLKDVRRAALRDAIVAAAAGDTPVSPVIVRRLVEDLGTRPSVAPSPRLALLSDREREVLEQVARGATNAEIAAALYVSESTVKTHLARVLTKLGLRDRVHAVVFGYESGLVQPGRGPGDDKDRPRG